LEVRVEDGRQSECCPVTGQIEVEPFRQHYFMRKQADFDRVFLDEKV
jgi:hypothetical protein